MVQRHSVVIPRDDGGVEVFPLKEWLRQHPEELPPGLDPTASTSHQLRNGLCKMGWTMQQTPNEVRLISPSGEDQADVIVELLGPPDLSDEELESPVFTLESQLRDFLASNLGSIDLDGKRLRLFVDPSGRDGVEYPSAVGPIDILAVDNDGAFFVFELKRANSPDRALGQVARYMGWIRETIGKDREVYGVIVSKTVSDNLKYARTVVPDVYLFEYEVLFSLKQAHDIPQLKR